MLTEEEYKKEFVRMMDSMRNVHKNELNCQGVICDKCHLREICLKHPLSVMPFKIIEAVERWSKEHPKVTYKDKFKEVFGVEPKDEDGVYVLPCSVGLIHTTDCLPFNCDKCRAEFWNSEYKETESGGKE